jgi:hypothetical protein
MKNLSPCNLDGMHAAPLPFYWFAIELGDASLMKLDARIDSRTGVHLPILKGVPTAIEAFDESRSPTGSAPRS